MVDAERHRRIDCRNGWVALPPQGARRGAGRAQLPAALRRRLFVRSLQNLKTTDTGVALDNLVTFQLSPDLSGYNDERGTIFYRDLLERLRSAPGVRSAAIANVPILSGDEWDSTMSVEGHRAKDGEDMQAFMNALARLLRDDADPDPRRARLHADGYQGALRAQHAQCRHREPPLRRAFLQGQERRRQTSGMGRRPDTKLTIEIIGVVADSLRGPA